MAQETQHFWGKVAGSVIAGLVLAVIIGAAGVMRELSVLSTKVDTLDSRLQRIERGLDRNMTAGQAHKEKSNGSQ